ncbi:hypothetical protein L2E82_06774 [Cichorium intybus]|uniref:Uncharacterized protein n=1 Tax=Cichorium intybus TaxID=13427 RepID=A0ACB9HBS0_CICIN|nr:hypothetical protein L2E82_06774 [Cichorium intybus]
MVLDSNPLLEHTSGFHLFDGDAMIYVVNTKSNRFNKIGKKKRPSLCCNSGLTSNSEEGAIGLPLLGDAEAFEDVHHDRSPKARPRFGELFADVIQKPYHNHFRFSPDGKKLKGVVVDLGKPTTVHDFAITENFVVVSDLHVKRVGLQAFKLELPPELSGIHDTFHVCYLKKYFGKEELVIPYTDLRVETPSKLIEEPEAILEMQTKKLRNKEIDLILVKWKHSLGSNLTWETLEEMKRKYPNFTDYDKIPRTESA